MAKEHKKTQLRTPPEGSEPKPATTPPDAGTRLVAWLQAHRKAVIAGAVAITIVALSAWFVVEYRRNKEAAAAQALEQARFTSQSGNLPLAANDLSRLIDEFSGTAAADEAVILLAQVRLLQEQPDLAADELRQADPDRLRSQFRSPAHGLLGTALENSGQAAGAAQAYEDASQASWYDNVAAEYLLDAGRAWTAVGDATRAVAAYQRILDDYSESPSIVEARVRLAELQARQASQ